MQFKQTTIRAITLISSVVILGAIGGCALTLTADTTDGLGQKTASITVLAPSISIYPNPAVPNQAVVITGTGFTPAASGAGRLGAHQITGIGPSVVSATGTTLGTSYVTYPIDVDTDGGLYARFRVPYSYVSHSGGSIIIKVRDSGNRTGSVDLALRRPEIYLVPATSGAGDKVQVIGSGFPVNSGLNSGCQRVKVLYKGIKVATAIQDSSASFSSTLEVPRTTTISSSNTVTVTPESCAGNLSATATHTVPSRSITVTPNLTWPGATVTVPGSAIPGSP